MSRVFKLGLIASFVLGSFVFGADFSKKSNNEIINLAGSVEPKDVFDYDKEIKKRMEDMTMKDAREFRTKIKEQETKIYDNMKVKDFKVRQKAIMESMREKCKSESSFCMKDMKGPRHMQGHMQGGKNGMQGNMRGEMMGNMGGCNCLDNK